MLPEFDVGSYTYIYIYIYIHIYIGLFCLNRFDVYKILQKCSWGYPSWDSSEASCSAQGRVLVMAGLCCKLCTRTHSARAASRNHSSLVSLLSYDWAVSQTSQTSASIRQKKGHSDYLACVSRGNHVTELFDSRPDHPGIYDDSGVALTPARTSGFSLSHFGL